MNNEMSSSSESDDESSVNFDDIFGENGVIQPFRFEPICSDSEPSTEVDNASRNSTPPPVFDDDMEWCSCGKCEYNIIIKEKVCCRRPQIFEEDVFDGNRCIVETDAFASVCLNRFVLQAAIGTWNDNNHENRNLEDRNYRFIAYKQYISWSYGYLGKRKRKPLPNCVITEIRRKYPDPNDTYVPYNDLI